MAPPPSSTTDSEASAGHSGASTVSAAPVSAASPPRLRWAFPLLVLLGGLAGAAGSEVIFRTHQLFQVESTRLGIPPYPPEIERQMHGYALANHALGFAGLGLLTCGLLALALVAMRGSPIRALGALALGAILGALFGAAGGVTAYQIDASLAPVALDGLFKAMLIHLPNWLLLAAALAVVAAVLVQPRPRASELFLAVIAAGAGAALLYPLLGLVFFPAAYTDRPVPFAIGVRVLCFAVGGSALGAAAARWLRSALV